MIIQLSGAINARDLGGIVTPYGSIKHNKLVRSGELSRLTTQDIDLLKQKGLARVVDLRTSTEKSVSPNVQMDGVEYVQIPIIEATTFGITYEKSDGKQIALMLKAGIERMKARGEDCTEHLAILYQKFVNDPFSRNGYGKFLRLLANCPVDGATLWHCTVGKDRCGTCTALLLHCLGATKEQIFEDYLLTNQQTLGHKMMILDKVRDFVTPEDLALIDTMRSVKREYLESFFGEIQQKFDNIENFLQQCGISHSDVENLRKNYLE